MVCSLRVWSKLDTLGSVCSTNVWNDWTQLLKCNCCTHPREAAISCSKKRKPWIRWFWHTLQPFRTCKAKICSNDLYFRNKHRGLEVIRHCSLSVFFSDLHRRSAFVIPGVDHGSSLFHLPNQKQVTSHGGQVHSCEPKTASESVMELQKWVDLSAHSTYGEGKGEIRDVLSAHYQVVLTCFGQQAKTWQVLLKGRILLESMFMPRLRRLWFRNVSVNIQTGGKIKIRFWKNLRERHGCFVVVTDNILA